MPERAPVSLEEWWDQVSSTTTIEIGTKPLQRDYERQLQEGMVMSMSMPMPTAAPGPTQIPTTRPTQSPTRTTAPSGTPRPTGPPIAPTHQPTVVPTSAPVPVPTAAPVVPTPPTPLPTEGPTVVCFDDLEQYILDLLTPITDVDILLDSTTPQGRAFDFLVNEDLYLANPCGKTVEQRYGLVTIFFSTNGESWTDNDLWLEPIQECGWSGVVCDDDLSVTGLNLGTSRSIA